MPEIARATRRLVRLKNFGRFTEGLQIIILGTFGQYIYSGGAQQLGAKHWEAAREFFGGYQGVGISLMVIASIGLLGLLTLGFTKQDTLYSILMWIYSLSAATWFITVGITHHLAQSGSTGLWSLGMAGLWFLGTRIAVTIAAPINDLEELRAQPTSRG